MKHDNLITFLKKFNLEKEIINEFLKNKKLIEINQNIFLINTNFKLKPNQIYTDTLIFIKLNQFLPSKFLLNFIKDNTENKIEIISEKTALNFTYTKKLLPEHLVKQKYRYVENKNYIVLFKEKILGIGEFIKEERGFHFKNSMNIGEYLQEN